MTGTSMAAPHVAGEKATLTWNRHIGYNPQNIGTIPAGGTAQAVWYIRYISPLSTQHYITFEFTNRSKSYGESFTGSGSKKVYCKNVYWGY